MFEVQTPTAAWTKVAFGDVVRRSTERSSNPLAEGFERVIGLEHIDPGDLRLRRWGRVSDGTTFTNIFRPGQVLFGKRRAYQRKVAVATFSGVCSGDIYVLEAASGELLPELLPFICKTEAFLEHAVGTSAGSLSPRTNWASLASFEFHLPPLEEQRRISKALLAMNSYQDSAREALAAIDITIQSLRDTFFGLQSGSVSLATLCDNGRGIQIGPFGSQLHRSDYQRSGVPVVMPSDLGAYGIEEEHIARVSEDKANTLAQHRLLPGDIVLPRRGNFDRRAVVGKREEGWLCGTGCIRVRLDNPDLAPSLAQSLASWSVLQWLQSRAVGTTMPNLNLQIVGAIPVRTPEDSQDRQALQAIMDLQLQRRALQGRVASVMGLESRLSRRLA